MKIALSTDGKELSSNLDPRFGRANGFILYDLDNDQYEYMSNIQNLNAPQGAGIQTAQNIAGAGVQAVITGHIGPKAFAALQAGGIKIYLNSSGTVEQAIESFRSGSLNQALGADKSGHW